MTSPGGGGRLVHAILWATAMGLSALAPGCSPDLLPAPDLERMLRQARHAPYQASALFADGKVMREPPPGTVPRERVIEGPALALGVEGGAYVTTPPLPRTRAHLDRGRQRFDIYCAPCHGVAGDGQSRVAANMTLRPPPTLVGPRVAAFPDGRIYQVITAGYGFMRPYAEDLPVGDRWAVVAYVRALQLGAGAPLSALPPGLRARVEEAIP